MQISVRDFGVPDEWCVCDNCGKGIKTVVYLERAYAIHMGSLQVAFKLCIGCLLNVIETASKITPKDNWTKV